VPGDTRADGVEDPLRQLLDPVPDQVRSLRRALWIGIGALTVALALAAVAVPSLISNGQHDLSQTGAPPPSGSATVPAAPGGPLASAAAPSSPAASPRPSAGPSGSSAAARSTATGTTGGAGAPTRAGGPPATDPHEPVPRGGEPAFTPVSVQAEDPGNTLDNGAAITDCDTCDGGYRVRYVGRVTVYLTIAAAGSHTLTTTYESDGDLRSINVSINGGAPTNVRTPGDSWTTPQTFDLTVAFPAGRVSIAYYNDRLAPDIDKVAVS
jgi:hypothetical protein